MLGEFAEKEYLFLRFWQFYEPYVSRNARQIRRENLTGPGTGGGSLGAAAQGAFPQFKGEAPSYVIHARACWAQIIALAAPTEFLF